MAVKTHPAAAQLKTLATKLRAQYAVECDALYARHPGQEENREYYDTFRKTARLGQLTKRARFSGAMTAERGDYVLFVDKDDEPGYVIMWHPVIRSVICPIAKVRDLAC